MRHAFHALAAALLFTGAAHAAPQVQISPTAANLLPGELVEVTITGTGFDMTTFGGGLSLQWDPDVLDLDMDSVVVHAATWETARSGGLLDAASGTLSDMYFASFIGRSGTLAIATLRFVADNPGSTALTMSGSTDFPFADEMAEVMTVSFTGANITVTAVPEPSAALLLLGGLAGLAWRRRAA